MKLVQGVRVAALVGLSLLVGFPAVAQEKSPTVAQEKPNRALTIENVGSNLSAERIKALEETARTIAENSQNSANTAIGRRIAEASVSMARRVDDIADATLTSDRDRVLRFLGIDPAGRSSVYYFVSYEMPIEVLRAYVIDAMWSGGTLVFRGIPKGRDMMDFITKDLRELIYGKGASASLSIDPRLFDGYKITTVPTIVYTEERKNFMCTGVNPKPFTYENEKHTYDTCPPVDETKYWKIAGAVTTDFALREFINAGGKGAQVHLDALAKGFATGTVAPKNQQAFTGEWKAAITPEELLSVKAAVDLARQVGSKVPEALKPSPK
jgi:type-F conjugative transfer system pilin assembly protein TrbC